MQNRQYLSPFSIMIDILNKDWFSYFFMLIYEKRPIGIRCKKHIIFNKGD